MCGIAGILSSSPSLVNRHVLQKMGDSLAHRGPDCEGFWINKNNKVGFAHRRLAIIDLSAEAAQPMHLHQRYSIVFNGEIYNYIELGRQLTSLGHILKTNSDTEIILGAYAQWGQSCVDYFDGMFAFAIWDQEKKQLFCARDRFGEKPFYYFRDKDLFIFGSEMKALWAAGVDKNIDNKMMLNYISLGHVQNPADKSQTFYKNIYALPPSTTMMFHEGSGAVELNTYFKIKKDVIKPIKHQHALSIFGELMQTSIKRRMRSDVAVGSSLSGGLDSSSIAYFMQKIGGGGQGDFKTFSAIFPDFERNEEQYVDGVVKKLELINFKVETSASDLADSLSNLAWHQEEPFGSSSIFAQYKVFELAKAHGIKVLLDGQGADEMLAGYNRYIPLLLQQKIARFKFQEVKKHLEKLESHRMPVKWGIRNYVAAYFPSHVSMLLERKEYRQTMHNPDLNPELISHVAGSHWEGIHKPIVRKLNDILHFNTMEMGLEEMLRFADRSSMACGVEVRMPFLNAELMKFVFSLPDHYKISRGYTKFILRRLMKGKLPNNIVWRTDKVGFEPPQKMWMASEAMQAVLHDAKSTLIDARILKAKVLDRSENMLDAHAAHNKAWRYISAAQMFKI